jgi:hypothetical protein
LNKTNVNLSVSVKNRIFLVLSRKEKQKEIVIISLKSKIFLVNCRKEKQREMWLKERKVGAEKNMKKTDPCH